MTLGVKFEKLNFSENSLCRDPGGEVCTQATPKIVGNLLDISFENCT